MNKYTMDEEADKLPIVNNDISSTEEAIDEKLGIMIYGHIKIIDIDTNEILVDKRA
jgi:hypothetical protein